ncbi:MAG: hypothetical protein M5U19_04455 [Microthrixaceae bacterium]|nr:hypothetical protein [Microthrixaceae bacterium]
MSAQRERSRAAAGSSGVETGDAADTARSVLAEHGPTVFVGREVASVRATVLAVTDEGVLSRPDTLLRRIRWPDG